MKGYKVLVTSDLHGNLYIINKLIEVARKYKIDAIIICGDILPKGKFSFFRIGNNLIYTSVFGIPPALISNDVDSSHLKLIGMGLIPESLYKHINYNEILKYILEKLSEFPTYIIQGNDDLLEPEIWKKTIEEVPNILDINKRKCVIYGEWSIIGFNNILLTPWNTRFEMDEVGISKELEKLLPLIDESKKWIFVTHMPPFGFGDQLTNGFSVGSKSLLQFIKKYSPTYSFFGHIHEAFGRFNIENTTSANVSSLWNIYDWSASKMKHTNTIAQFRGIIIDILTSDLKILKENITLDYVNKCLHLSYFRKYFKLVTDYDDKEIY